MLRRVSMSRVGVAVVAVVALLACCVDADADDVFAGWSRYVAETTVVLSASRDELAGYRVRGKVSLHATTTTTDDDDGPVLLLTFRFQDMELLLRGAETMSDYSRRGSVWEARDDVLHVQWAVRAGRVLRVLHDPALPSRVLDHARAIISLFQFHTGVGGAGGGRRERNETDVSGECEVLYETLGSDVFRKVKRRCEHDDVGAAGGLDARRVVRYTLAGGGGGGGLAAVLGDEVVTVRVADLAVKARSLHTLTLLEHRPSPPPSTAPPPHYVEATLAMSPHDVSDPDDDLTVEEAVQEFGVALEGQEAGAGGSAEGVAALLRLLPVLQGASADAVTAVLRAEHRSLDALRAVCGALGLAGTAAGAVAIRRAQLPEPVVREYLAGLGVALAPHPAAVADALALAEEPHSTPTLAEAALLAAAGASARASDPALAARLRDRITRSLARCKEERCRGVRLAALGNTGAGEAVETLLAHAESGAAGRAALAALGAGVGLQPAHLGRLLALVGNETRPLEERAAGLDLLVERECRGPALPLRTAAAWRALHAQRGPAAGELRRLLAQRVAALADTEEGARRLLAALPPQLRGWDAPPGASTVLVRATGWGAAGWRAELDSRQVTSRGLLRRGRVSLEAASPPARRLPLLSVELWTRGLAALADSADADADADDETMSAGLGLSVAGVSLPDVDLFEGQGELVGHIWAGTGSADTRVVRAAWPVAMWRAAVPLAGGVTLGVRAGAALAAALDARASVSLWQRAARGALVLRAAAAARLVARLAPAPDPAPAPAPVPAGADLLQVEARAGAAARLRIHADLDFYEGVSLCVRATTSGHVETRDIDSESRQGARRRRVSRTRSTRTARAGRTLSLGRENDLACRTLRSADDDDDE